MNTGERKDDRIHIAANDQVVEFTDPAEAATAQTALLRDAPEGTPFTVTVEFTDGDAWSMTAWREGDMVYCKPDLRTRRGLSADPILRGFGLEEGHPHAEGRGCWEIRN